MKCQPSYGWLLVAALGLGACDMDIRGDVKDGVEGGQRLTTEQRARLKAAQRGEVIVERAPYYGAQVAVKRGSRQGKPLPRKVEGARGVTLAIAHKAPIKTIAEAVEAATGIPVSMRTRYILEGGDVIDVPIGTYMKADYEGPLSAFLDRLAARMDVAWSYDGSLIVIDRMVTRDWRIPLPVGTTTLTDSAATTRGPDINSVREFDPWGELGTRLASIAPPPSQITLSPGSGRVSVFGPPSVQTAVSRVLEDVQATASTRIGLDVAVYFVDTDKADQFGIGLANIGGTLGSYRGQDVSATLTAAARTSLGGAGLRLARGTGVNARALDFRALARSGAVVDYRLASTIAQSGVISPIALTEQRNYIRSTTTTRVENSTQQDTSFEIGELQTGLEITALPRLIDSNQIQLALTISQRAFKGFDESVESRSGIQAPTVENREIRNDSVLAPGETLILSGYEQDRSEQGTSGVGFLHRIGLGGDTNATRKKVRMIFLVRPFLIATGERG